LFKILSMVEEARTDNKKAFSVAILNTRIQSSNRYELLRRKRL